MSEWMFALFPKASQPLRDEWRQILQDFETTAATEGIRHYHEHVDHHGFVDTSILLGCIRARMPRAPIDSSAKVAAEAAASQRRREEDARRVSESLRQRQQVMAAIAAMPEHDLQAALQQVLQDQPGLQWLAGRDVRTCYPLAAAVVRRLDRAMAMGVV